MVAVAVCTFHNNIIRFGGITGVMDDGLIDIADITGEYDFFDTPFSVSQISILRSRADARHP